MKEDKAGSIALASPNPVRGPDVQMPILQCEGNVRRHGRATEAPRAEPGSQGRLCRGNLRGAESWRKRQRGGCQRRVLQAEGATLWSPVGVKEPSMFGYPFS